MTSSPPPFDRRSPGSLIFIADLHLRPGPSARGEAFAELLSLLARPPRPAGLYILGDLFDVWSGKGSLADPGHLPVISSLRSLAGSGVALTIFKGNRDFLLDAGFASRSRSNLVEEGLPIRLGSRRAFLCHGDHLFWQDRLHQRSRAVLRSAVCRGLAAALPARAVDGIARGVRARSGSAGRRRRAEGDRGFREAGIPARAAARVFRGGFDVLIAGHVHEERRRVLRVDGRDHELWTLGAWDDRGSILEFSEEGLGFRAWPFGRE